MFNSALDVKYVRLSKKTKLTLNKSDKIYSSLNITSYH